MPAAAVSNPTPTKPDGFSPAVARKLLSKSDTVEEPVSFPFALPAVGPDGPIKGVAQSRRRSAIAQRLAELQQAQEESIETETWAFVNYARITGLAPPPHTT
jgi:hypothetical protein